MVMVSGVWWNPFTWFDEETGFVLEKSPQWNVEYSTDDNTFIYIAENNKHKSEICLIYTNVTDTSQLADREFYYSNKLDGKDKIEEPKIKATRLKAEDTIFDNDIYGYCYKVKDKEKYLKFGTDSTVLSFENESINIIEDNVTISEIVLKTDQLHYRAGKPNIKVGLGYVGLHEIKITNPTASVQTDVLSDTKFINMKNGEELIKDYDIKYLSYDNITQDVWAYDDCTLLGNGTNQCTPYVSGTETYLKEKWTLITGTIDLDPSEEITVKYFMTIERYDYFDIIPTIHTPITLWASIQEDFSAGLVHYYQFNETTGPVIDIAGNSNGSLIATPTRGLNGIIERAFNYTTADAVNTNVVFNETEGSMGFWYNATGGPNSGARFIASRGAAEVEAYVSVSQEGPGFRFFLRVGGGTQVDASTDFSTNSFVVITWKSGDNMSIFLDGVLANSTVIASFTPALIYPLHVSGWPKNSGVRLNGLIDELMIYNRTLSPTEVSEIYNGGAGIPFFGVGTPTVQIGLGSPVNGTIFTNSPSTLLFNCSNVQDDSALANVSLVVNDGVTNTTVTPALGSNNLYNLTLLDGTFDYFCRVVDDENITGVSENRTFIIDSTAPIVTILEPVNNTILNAPNATLELNFTITEPNPDTCFYTYASIPELLFNDSNIISTTASGVLERGWVFITDNATQVWNYEINDAGGGTMEIKVARQNNTGNVVSDFQTLSQDPNPQNVTINITGNGFHYWELIHTPFAGSTGTADLFRAIGPVANATNETFINCATNTTFNFTQGSNSLTLFSNDTAGNIGLATTNFFPNTLAPQVNILSPPTSFINLALNETLDLNLSIVSNSTLDTCILSYNGGNTTFNCSTNTTFGYLLNVNNLTVHVNDSFGNINSTLRVWTVSFIEINQTFNSPVVEGSTEDYEVVFDLGPSLTLVAADFVYEGVSSDASISQIGTLATVTKVNFIVPGAPVLENKSFFWTLTVSDSSTTNSTTQLQLVSPINLDNCSTFGFVLYNYTMVDEETQGLITGVSENTLLELDLQLFTSDKSSEVFNFSTQYVQTNPNQAVCADVNLFNSSSFIVDSTAKYSSDGRQIEYYNIRDSVINNASVTQNITLFNIKNSSSTVFQITFKDSNFVVVENALIQVNRQYVSEGVFKTVEIPITDSNGQTVGHLTEDDIVYNFIVSKEGEVIGLFNNLIAFCEDSTIGQCFISLNALAGTGQVFNPDTSSQVSFLPLAFNSTTRDLTLQYSTNDGSVKTVLMTAIKLDQIGNVTVCNSTITSSSGTLTCNIPNSFGNETIIVDVFVNTKLTLTSYFSAANDIDLGFSGFFIMLFFVVSLGLMVSESKSMIIIGIIMGFIMSSLLYLVEGGLLAGVTAVMWLVINGFILIWKLNREGTT